MPIRGWVYIISNKAMPGLIKVGYSTKDPQLRASELNHTGSPHPYFVEYDVLVTNPKDMETKTHSALSNKREGKEWFRCSVNEAINTVRLITNGKAITERALVANFTPQPQSESLNLYRDSAYCHGCHTLVQFNKPVNDATFSICPKCGRVVTSKLS
ncbi:MAG: GIY-YIG nuclease family protein [Thiobacillus sp.]